MSECEDKKDTELLPEKIYMTKHWSGEYVENWSAERRSMEDVEYTRKPTQSHPIDDKELGEAIAICERKMELSDNDYETSVWLKHLQTLIKAAELLPELVEALERALSEMEDDYVDDVWGRDLGYIKNALKKYSALGGE